MKTGIELIAIERAEQIEKHGRSLESDKANNKDGQLSFAAALLCAPNPNQYARPENNYGCPENWSVKIWIKMIQKSWEERLIIAGALIAAEIDRLNGIKS